MPRPQIFAQKYTRTGIKLRNGTRETAPETRGGGEGGSMGVPWEEERDDTARDRRGTGPPVEDRQGGSGRRLKKSGRGRKVNPVRENPRGRNTDMGSGLRRTTGGGATGRGEGGHGLA